MALAFVMMGLGEKTALKDILIMGSFMGDRHLVIPAGPVHHAQKSSVRIIAQEMENASMEHANVLKAFRVKFANSKNV